VAASFFCGGDVIGLGICLPRDWCRMIFRVLPILLVRLASATWADAETVDVEQRGAVNLTPFACQDITRSSLISRVCYDAANRVMIVQMNAAYSQYCDVPEAVRDQFLNAPSMGQYYKANIKRPGAEAPYQCRAPKH
jgi:hypothetical protein